MKVGNTVFRKHKAWLVILVLVSCLLAGQPLERAAGQGESHLPLKEIHGQLDSLGAAEKEIIAALFAVTERIRQQEGELEALGERQKAVEEALAWAEVEYEEAAEQYEEARLSATEALRWLQRLGPVSYLDLIVGSATFNEFWQRLDVIFIALRGVERALGHLFHTREMAALEKGTLEDMQAELKGVLAAAANKLQQLQATREEKEAALDGLGDRRQEFEERLLELERVWLKDIIPYLKAAASELATLMGKGGREALPVQWQFTRWGMEGSLSFKDLNVALSPYPSLRGAYFSGKDGRLFFTVPERGLSLGGELSIVEDGKGGSFDIDEIYLLGMPISPSALLEYHDETHFVFTVPSPLPSIRLRRIRVTEEALVLVVSL
ncbi:MAG: hypothetical protein GX376_07480 [Firmicutes bacterium]|nr:hypothetical protein [Bacillota bacterium]